MFTCPGWYPNSYILEIYGGVPPYIHVREPWRIQGNPDTGTNCGIYLRRLSDYQITFYFCKVIL
jgi:hypothetical protein